MASGSSCLMREATVVSARRTTNEVDSEEGAVYCYGDATKVDEKR